MLKTISQLIKDLNYEELVKLIPELKELKTTTQNEIHGFDTVWEHTEQVIKGLKSRPAFLISDILYISALLHDIGKPKTKSTIDGKIRFINHEKVGAEMSKTILHRLGLDSIIDKVIFIIENHMKLIQFNNYSKEINIRILRKLMFYAKDDNNFNDLIYLTIEDKRAVKEEYKDYEYGPKVLFLCSNISTTKGGLGYTYKLLLPSIYKIRDVLNLDLETDDEKLNKYLEILVKHIIKNNLSTDVLTEDYIKKFFKGVSI